VYLVSGFSLFVCGSSAQVRFTFHSTLMVGRRNRGGAARGMGFTVVVMGRELRRNTSGDLRRDTRGDLRRDMKAHDPLAEQANLIFFFPSRVHCKIINSARFERVRLV
jgi:hypothetical protein